MDSLSQNSLSLYYLGKKDELVANEGSSYPEIANVIDIDIEFDRLWR